MRKFAVQVVFGRGGPTGISSRSAPRPLAKWPMIAAHAVRAKVKSSPSSTQCSQWAMHGPSVATTRPLQRFMAPRFIDHLPLQWPDIRSAPSGYLWPSAYHPKHDWTLEHPPWTSRHLDARRDSQRSRTQRYRGTKGGSQPADDPFPRSGQRGALFVSRNQTRIDLSAQVNGDWIEVFSVRPYNADGPTRQLCVPLYLPQDVLGGDFAVFPLEREALVVTDVLGAEPRMLGDVLLHARVMNFSVCAFGPRRMFSEAERFELERLVVAMYNPKNAAAMFNPAREALEDTVVPHARVSSNIKAKTLAGFEALQQGLKALFE